MFECPNRWKWLVLATSTFCCFFFFFIFSIYYRTISSQYLVTLNPWKLFTFLSKLEANKLFNTSVDTIISLRENESRVFFKNLGKSYDHAIKFQNRSLSVKKYAIFVFCKVLDYNNFSTSSWFDFGIRIPDSTISIILYKCFKGKNSKAIFELQMSSRWHYQPMRLQLNSDSALEMIFVLAE